MKNKKVKTITSECFRQEPKYRSKIVRRGKHNNKNTFLEYIKMLFF